MQVDAAFVTISTADREIPAYRAMPDAGGPFPVVLVVQEIFGVHAWVQDVCRRLACAGYFAIAPDLYVRQGDPTAITDMGALIRDIVSKVPDVQVMSDLDAAVAYAQRVPRVDALRLAITGFCWGGRIAWMYAGHNPAVRAAVPWYGPVARAYHSGDATALEIVPRIEAAVLGLYGGDDPGIPNDTTARIVEAMRSAGKTVEIVTYPDTPHAFLADYRPSYRKGPAEDGWKRMLDWFANYLR